eukprot:scaffold33904_cov157-Isochrysis_galbana.AAC.2
MIWSIVDATCGQPPGRRRRMHPRPCRPVGQWGSKAVLFGRRAAHQDHRVQGEQIAFVRAVLPQVLVVDVGQECGGGPVQVQPHRVAPIVCERHALLDSRSVPHGRSDLVQVVHQLIPLRHPKLAGLRPNP